VLSAPKRAALSEAAEVALALLRDGPLTADELVRTTGMTPAAGSAALIELELAGAVALEDGVYRVTP
jgi:predicted Rossmann fold nucleotide-binding protein DprA/Smf involved in DNA uptake